MVQACKNVLIFLYHCSILIVRKKAKGSEGRVLSWIFDYMAVKRLPQPGPKNAVREYQRWKELFHGFTHKAFNRIKLSIAGLFDRTEELSYYTLHTNLNENANSILTILFSRLQKQLDEHRKPDELNLSIDGKSTGKNL